MTQGKLFVAGMLVLLAAIIGNAILGLGNYDSVRSAQRSIRGLVQSTATLGRQNARNLVNYKAAIATRRAQTKRTLAKLAAQNATNRRLTEQVGRLAAQRNADNTAAIRRAASLSAANRREVAALSQAQSRIAQAQTRITSLEASQHHESLAAQYDTCVQVERTKTAVRSTLLIIFANVPLSPAQQADKQRILAKFQARVCVKP